MRILLYTSTFFPTTGGAEYVVHYLATHFTRMGHTAHVLAPRPKRSKGKDDIPKEYPVYYYFRPPSQKRGVRITLLRLFQLQFRHDYDVVHCHVSYPPGYVAATFKRFARPGIIVTPHGSDVIPTERLRQNPRLDRRVHKALKSADAVTAISRSMRDTIIGAGAPDGNVHLIPNGIELSECEVEGEFPHPRPYILAVGGFRKRKGFDTAIRAFHLIADDFPGIDFYIAGDGVERENLERLVSELGMEERIKLPGNVLGPDKVRLYNSCLFFVCPSRWEEPFGIVNLEAMAAGKCVVATARGGIVDIVVDGETGLLVRHDDPGAMADAFRRVLSDEGLRASLGTNGARRVQEFTWEKVARQYLDLFEKTRNAKEHIGEPDE